MATVIDWVLAAAAPMGKLAPPRATRAQRASRLSCFCSNWAVLIGCLLLTDGGRTARQDYRAAQEPWVVRVQAPGQRPGHGQALHQDEAHHGVLRGRDPGGPRGAHLVLEAWGGGPRHHTTERGPRVLIGPWRSSMAGYASVQAALVSRSLRAASLARAAPMPRPMKTNCSKRPGSTGSAVDRARSAAVASAVTSSPRCARSSARAEVAKRVWTTEASSAKPSTIVPATSSDSGVPWTAVTPVTRELAWARPTRSSTSLVVPERVITTTWS